jgi:hypothetical protein
MIRTIRTRAALAIAAAAVAASVAAPIVPAFAAPPAPAVEHESQLFKPDIEVTYLYYAGNGRDVYKVRNLGSVASGPIFLKGECYHQEQSGQFKWIPGIARIDPPLQENQSRNVTVGCKGGGYLTTRLTAGTQNDLDPSNNVATSN